MKKRTGTSRNIKENILPEGGTVHYYGKVLTQEKADEYFRRFLESIDWQQDEVVLFGKRIRTKRKTALHGNKNYSYTYSNTTKHALPWTKELAELRDLVEQLTGEVFNSCLLNLYHSGEEGMSWHSDNEKPLGEHPVIASLSLGAERRFSFKHRTTQQTLSIHLEEGSLLVMKEDTQKNWLHSLPKSKKIKEPRISLTFRKILEPK